MKHIFFLLAALTPFASFSMSSDDEDEAARIPFGHMKMIINESDAAMSTVFGTAPRRASFMEYLRPRGSQNNFQSNARAEISRQFNAASGDVLTDCNMEHMQILFSQQSVSTPAPTLRRQEQTFCYKYDGSDGSDNDEFGERQQSGALPPRQKASVNLVALAAASLKSASGTGSSEGSWNTIES